MPNENEIPVDAHQSTDAQQQVEPQAQQSATVVASTSPNPARGNALPITEFYDGAPSEETCFADKTKYPDRATVTKWKVLTRSGREVWLRQEPDSKHNSVTFTVTPEGYCNGATTSFKKDVSLVASVFNEASKLKRSHFKSVADDINQSADPQAAALMLNIDFDINKYLDS